MGPAHTHGPHISLVPRSHSHSGTRQGQSHGKCEDKVSPRLVCLAPAETQEKFLALIVSLLPKLRPLSGLGIEDGEELRGSLGLGKVELAGSWVPPQTLHSLPCPRSAGSPLSPGEERKGYQSSTSQWLCGPRPAALLLSSVSSSGMAWGGGELLDSWGLCLHTSFCHIQTCAWPLPCSFPRRAGHKPSAHCPPRSPCPGALCLFSAPTLQPLCAQSVCVEGAEGQDLDGAAGWCARGCKGPGAASQGSRVQGGVGESAHKLPDSWCVCEGSSEPLGLCGWLLWAEPLLHRPARGLLVAVLPAPRLDGRPGLPSCLVYHYSLLLLRG